MALTKSLQEIIQAALDSRAGEIYTSLPCRVESYDPTTQCVDVTPLIKRPLPTDLDNVIFEGLPVIPNVPVCFPRGGGFSVTWPISQGDTVLLIVTTYAIGAWRASGQVSEPGDVRMHGLGSAVAIPCLGSDANPLPSAQASANAFTIAGPMVILADPNATDFAALASKVDANFAAIKTQIASATCPALGGSLVSTPANTPSVACSKVKIA